MERLAGWAWRRFGPRYFKAYASFEAVSALVITVGGLGLLTLYEDVTRTEFLRIALFSCACVLVSLALGTVKAYKLLRPLLRWGGARAVGRARRRPGTRRSRCRSCSSRARAGYR